MRLQRIGRKNNPTYRVIVTDSRNAAKRGRSVDLLGSYDPKAGKFEIDAEKAKHWISKGVQLSDTVHNFLVSKKVIEGKKKNVLPRKSPIVDEAKIKAEAEAKAKADKVSGEAGEGALGQADAKAATEAADAPKEEEAATPTEETVTA